jgi:hypothetical protein
MHPGVLILEFTDSEVLAVPHKSAPSGAIAARRPHLQEDFCNDGVKKLTFTVPRTPMRCGRFAL